MGRLYSIKRNIDILIILLATISCDSFMDNNIHKVDDNIKNTYDFFIEEGLKRQQDYSGVPIILKFGELDNKLGVTKWRGDNVVEIIIDKSEWFHIDESINTPYTRKKNEVTVLHELGHGVLNRKHNSDCESIMITNDYCKYLEYEKNKKQMLDELFNVNP